MRQGWKEVKLGEISKMKSGKSKNKLEKGVFPIYGSNGIIGNSNQFNFENRIIIGRVGAYCGSIFYCQGKFWATDNTLIIDFNEFNDILFWKYLLQKFPLNEYAGGAAQPLLTQGILNNLKFKIPSLETQQKIAKILSSYDDLIENNLQRIKILEEMAQQTYEEWFVRMRFPGFETAKIDELTGLPEGWEKVKCFDAMEVLSGGTPKTNVDDYWNGEIEFFTPKDAKSGSYTNGTEKTVTELGVKKCNSKLYPKDTVFITARGTVGKLNLASKPMIMNQSCYALKGRNEISQFFLFCAMNSTIETFKSASNGGVFNTIIVDTFKFLDFIIPNVTLIVNFENFAKPIFNSIHNLQSQNQRLRETRDLLLPRLMMGILEV